MKLLRLFRFLWGFLTFFRVFGVPVQFHTSWLVFPCGFGLWGGWEWAGLKGALICLAFLGLLLGTVLIHEFAHVLVARRYGCNTRRILVIPFACIAELEAMILGTPEIWVAAAGPLASLLVSGLAWLAAQATHGHHGIAIWYVRQILMGTSVVNLGLAGFNLIPCFPMDGGRMFRSTLAVFLGFLFPRSRANPILLATRIAVRYVGRMIIASVFVLTILYTRLWHHLLIFSCLGLAGEAEFWLLRRATGALCKARELRFLPVTKESSARRGGRRPALEPYPGRSRLGLRIDPRTAGSASLSYAHLALDQS
jgi:Zn-dependent protease